MTVRLFADAVEARKNQTTFTAYETGCILAQVEPNAPMKESEANSLSECLRFHSEVAEWRRKFVAGGGNEVMFNRMIA